jgi:hypothetical protein
MAILLSFDADAGALKVAPWSASVLAGRYRLFRRNGTTRCMREKMVKRDRLSRGEQESGE